MSNSIISGSFIERQIENALKDVFNDNATRIMRAIRKLAAKQGGESTIENYQLLGKRALIVAGVAVVVIQVSSSVVSYVVSRKYEDQRIEQVVRRVLEEEKQAEAKA